MPQVLPFLIAAAEVAYAAVQSVGALATAVGGILNTVVFAGFTVGELITGAVTPAASVGRPPRQN